jgi:hypothetical protein
VKDEGRRRRREKREIPNTALNIIKIQIVYIPHAKNVKEFSQQKFQISGWIKKADFGSHNAQGSAT